MSDSATHPAAPTTGGFGLARKIPPRSGRYVWVYLWAWPIRAMHWIAAGCILTLVVTGLFIGRPYFVTQEGSSAAPFLMGWMRFLHFAAAATLVATGIIRVYWLFAGNKFERLRALFPLRGRDWVNMWKQVKFYLMVHPERAPHYLGHNPLQQISYTAIYLMTLIMVVTGFTMYGQSDPNGFFYWAFNWVAILLGGTPVVRFVHHVMTWLYLTFIPIHIYLAIRADNLEHTGVISSIITGGRFVKADEKFVDTGDTQDS